MGYGQSCIFDPYLCCSGLADHVVSGHEETVRCLREGVAVITEAERKLHRNRMLYWTLTSTIGVGVPLLCFFSDVPSQYSRTFHVSLVLLTAITIFSVVMSTVWHRIEWNGLRSSMMAMRFLADRMTMSSEETSSTIVSDAFIP